VDKLFKISSSSGAEKVAFPVCSGIVAPTGGKHNPKKAFRGALSRAIKNSAGHPPWRMLGRVSTLKYFAGTTLLLALREPALQALQERPQYQPGLPVPLLQARVPRPPGLPPVSVLLPFCSQLLQKIKSRRKAGKE
jgi:hypothetical protein